MTPQKEVDFLPRIDAFNCISCELCIRVCPNNVLGLDDIRDRPVLVNPDQCEYSGVCEEICPTGAISLTYEIIV